MMAKKRDLNEINIVSQELNELKKQSENYLGADKSRDSQKKKIIILCVALAVVVFGAFIGMIIYVESQSPVSYGPNVSSEEKTEEITKRHENRLEVIDKNGGVREGLNFVGYHAEIDENGNLIVDGYMRNFTGHEVYNITGNITVETPNEENIGGAYFEFTEKEFGSLKNSCSRPWRLVFNSDYVNVEITDLSSFTVTTEFDYYEK